MFVNLSDEEYYDVVINSRDKKKILGGKESIFHNMLRNVTERREWTMIELLVSQLCQW